MNKSELFEQIHAERALLEDALRRLTPEQMLLPGVTGAWSVKDTLAHITAWQQQMLRWARMRQRGERPDTPTEWDIDKINADFYARIKDLPLEEVLKDFHASHQAILVLLETLSEEQLQTEYTDSWPMAPFWRGIAADTFLHYKEHREDIEKWLAKP